MGPTPPLHSTPSFSLLLFMALSLDFFSPLLSYCSLVNGVSRLTYFNILMWQPTWMAHQLAHLASARQHTRAYIVITTFYNCVNLCIFINTTCATFLAFLLYACRVLADVFWHLQIKALKKILLLFLTLRVLPCRLTVTKKEGANWENPTRRGMGMPQGV